MNKLSGDTFLPPNDATDPADYENDFLLWIEKQVELLRAKKFEQLDLDNLIEEMDSMGKSLRRELGSRLKVLLMHLLKCEYQPEKKSGSWLGTIHTQRDDIAALLEENPSLRREVPERAQRAYASAVHGASLETGLPETTFPSAIPYSTDQLLDPRFFP
jgi:hypothetical protein